MTEYATLIQVVRSVRRRWRLRVLLRGTCFLLLSAVAFLLAAGYVIDASRFDTGMVTAARLFGYLTLAAVLIQFLIRPLLRRVSDRRAALYLEEHEPSLGGRVISAVELGSQPERAASPALLERLVDSATDACHEVEDGRRVERAGLWRSAAGAAGAALLALGLLGAGPTFLERTTPLLIAPWQEPAAVNPYRIQVEPGDTTVARGADLRVTARLEGFDATDVELAVRAEEGEDWQRWPMLREQDAHSLIVFDLEAPSEYFVEASGVRSSVHRIEVLELPYVEDIHLTYRFPAYTGLEPQEQAGSGDIAALTGTVVEITVTPTLPVPGGAIELGSDVRPSDDNDSGAPAATTLPLIVGEDGRLTGSLTVRESGSYRILLDGPTDRGVASADYLIDPLSDQPPIVRINRPGRDIRASNLEEITFDVKAQDDYGVAALELVYAVGGGEERTVPLYRGRTGRKDLGRSHTLFLEELERPSGGLLQPGDLVSYYARATDAAQPGPDASPNRTVTDIYFLEIRPFDRNYRQADQGGLPGGGQGMSGAELTAQQRMIIAATFKSIHGRLAGGASDDNSSAGDLATVALSQGRLREQVETLVGRLQARDLTAVGGADDSPVATMIELLPLAATEMKAAEQALGELRPEQALAPEQKALQLLQRAEAAFTDVEVSEGQQGGGGGGGGGDIREELADLFEQERDRLRNRYEQVQRGDRQRRDDAIDETLEKLRELARRQQQENERMRARARQAGQNTQAGSAGRSQRQLAEETEEVARQLERLARQQSSPELEQTAQQLREAVEEMRRAAAAGERAGEAIADAALERLREARRQLERGKSGRTLRDTRDAMRRAQRLREQQQRMIDRVERLEDGDAEELAAIHETKERMGAEVGELEASLDQLSRDARRDQPEASRRLGEAAGEIRESKIREKILYSRGVVQQRSKDYARNFEQHIEGTLGELEERLAEAAAAIGEDREQRLERALEQTRDAVNALESLEEQLRAGAPQDQTAEGTPQGGAPEAGNVPLSPRQLRRELGQRAAQLERLRGALGEEGVEASDLEAIIGHLRQLGSDGTLAETLAALDAEIVRGLKEFEFALRRSLAPAGEARALQAADRDVPEGYEEMVDRYYKALAGEGSPGR